MAAIGSGDTYIVSPHFTVNVYNHKKQKPTHNNNKDEISDADNDDDIDSCDGCGASKGSSTGGTDSKRRRKVSGKNTDNNGKDNNCNTMGSRDTAANTVGIGPATPVTPVSAQ